MSLSAASGKGLSANRGIAYLCHTFLQTVRSARYIKRYCVKARNECVTLRLARILEIRLRPDTARWIGYWLIVAAERAEHGDAAFMCSGRSSIGGAMAEVPGRALSVRTSGMR
jgi:hypothetical protein